MEGTREMRREMRTALAVLLVAVLLSVGCYSDYDFSDAGHPCSACRECEERCPQNILISKWMPKVHDHLVTLPA